MLKEFSVRINIVKHDIGVAAVARGEENQLESVDQVVQQGKGVGSDVNTRFEDLASLHFDSEFDVAWDGWAFVAMDQCLVEVEDQRFLVSIELSARQFQSTMVEFIHCRPISIFKDLQDADS